MTGSELRFNEVLSAKDNLLDSQIARTPAQEESISAKLAREGELLKDGLSSGFSARLAHAQENVAETVGEIGLSAGIGAALTYGLKAGGKYGTAAKIAGSVFMLGMGADLTRRAVPTLSAMGDTWHSGTNMDINKQTVATYAGSALFDYPVMLASGAAGSGAVAFGPRAMRAFSEMPVMEPNRSLAFQIAQDGRFGAKEVVGDQFSAIRDKFKLADPKTSLDFASLGKALEMRQLATHESTGGTWAEMVAGIEKVDALKPKIKADEVLVKGLERELTELGGAKAETRAVHEARERLAALDGNKGKIEALTAEQTQLAGELKAATKPEAGAEGKAKGKGKDEPQFDVEAARTRLREIRETVAEINRSEQNRTKFEQDLAAAQTKLTEKQQAIAEGKDPGIADVTSKLTEAQTRLTANQAELTALSGKLADLNASFEAKAAEVRPSLGGGGLGSGEVALPKKAAAEPVAPARKVEAPQRVKPVRSEVEAAVPPRQAERTTTAPERSAPAGDRNSGGGRDRQFNNGDRQGGRQEQRGGDRRNDRGREQRQEQRVEETTKPVTADDVAAAFKDANQKVDAFVTTRKSHTVALKAVEKYIQTAFDSFAADAKMQEQAGAVLKNVEGMLGKMDNWQRGASWFKPQEVSQIKGLPAEQVGKFTEWFDSVKGNYTPKGNQMPELTLSDIQTHLRNRVAVESVKHWLRTSPDLNAAVSPIVDKGFNMIKDGKLPDGRPIPDGSSMIVLVERNTPDGKVIAPFAKDGQHMQWFDGDKIVAGMRKQEIMAGEGPKGLTAEELYAFMPDHNPARLIGSAQQQAGFAILRPGGQWGKNVAYFELAPNVDTALVPKNLKMDGPGPRDHGTNVGVLINMLRNLNNPRPPKAAPAAPQG